MGSRQVLVGWPRWSSASPRAVCGARSGACHGLAPGCAALTRAASGYCLRWRHPYAADAAAGEGRSVLLAAADTFRAAAKEQLAIWADRNKVEIVSQAGGDPAAVSFDAVSAGRARGKNVVIVDTAGRLPTQLHLMEELRKIKRVVAKADATAPHEVLLVIDGNTGQNALQQVKAFDAVLQLTGLVVTKLDGTAKGGVLAAIAQEKPLPVYFIGVGEKLEDLETFKAREFALALLS